MGHRACLLNSIYTTHICYWQNRWIVTLSQLTSGHRLFTLWFYHGKHNDTRHRRSWFANLSDNSTPAFPNRSMKAYDTLNSKTDKLNHLGSFSRIHYYYFIKKKAEFIKIARKALAVESPPSADIMYCKHVSPTALRMIVCSWWRYQLNWNEYEEEKQEQI